MNKEIIITAKKLTKSFPSGTEMLQVLKGIDLEIRKGEILSIIGPSGAGKSTLLHILGLLDYPTSGEISFKQQSFASFKPIEKARIRNRQFGFVFQFYHLIPELNALGNTILPYMINYSLGTWLLKKAEIKKRCQDLLNDLGLGARIHHQPKQLSGGEQQRVALARALITQPEIVFCDEPTGNLDTTTSREIQNLIWRLNQSKGITFIVVTHEENIARKAHRMIRLVDGQIVT